MRKIAVMFAIGIVMIGYLFMTAPITEGKAIHLRALGTTQSLDFSSYKDLQRFFENNKFMIIKYQNDGSVKVLASINKEYLTWTRTTNYETYYYYVIAPYSYQSPNGEYHTLASGVHITIRNMPKNVGIIITGFSKAYITASNVAGLLELGSYVNIQTASANMLWIFNLGYTYKTMSFSGLADTMITVQNANGVLVSDYVGAMEIAQPLTFTNVQNLTLQGVSMSAYSNSPYSAAIRVIDAKNVNIENGPTQVLDVNGHTFNEIYGLNIRGYATGLMLQNVGNLSINGLVNIGGWTNTTSGRGQVGIWADNVTHVKYGTSAGQEINNDGNFIARYVLNATESQIYEVTNGSTSPVPNSYNSSYSGKFTSVLAIAAGSSKSASGFIELTGLSLPGGFFNYSAKVMYPRGYVLHVPVGFDLYNKNWGWFNESNSSTIISKSIIPKSVEDSGATEISSHTFEIVKNKSAYVSFEMKPTLSSTSALQNMCNFYRELIHSQHTVVWLNNTTSNSSAGAGNNSSNSTVYFVKYTNMTWTGYVEFYGGLTGKSPNVVSMRFENLDFGLGVPGNGSKEQELISLIQSDNVIKDSVGQVVCLNYAQPNTQKYQWNTSFFGLGTMMTFLIAFAFMRWAYGYTKAMDTGSQEDIGRSRELLRNIFIGAVIVVFVMTYWAILLHMVVI